MALIISRRDGQAIVLDGETTIRVVIRPGQFRGDVKLEIEGPAHVRREELKPLEQLPRAGM
jgi:sRNA-binding carbon storage regulator CsrA